MYLGRVTGSVWATVKDPAFQALALRIVQPLNDSLEPSGKQVVCTDIMGVGPGELIYYTKGKESSFPFLPVEVPTDMTIVGIVDAVTHGGRGGA